MGMDGLGGEGYTGEWHGCLPPIGEHREGEGMR